MKNEGTIFLNLSQFIVNESSGNYPLKMRITEISANTKPDRWGVKISAIAFILLILVTIIAKLKKILPT